jgi:peptidoglycan/xylan/chitin deacetylase (PgdA/CDA1 family)
VFTDLSVSLTFDIEKDWSPLLQTTLGIEMGLPKIMKLLEKYKIGCTFFITGEVAELFPDIVRQIAERHEVASHGYRHETFHEMTVHKKESIMQSKRVLEKATNQRVIGFRAPRFLVSGELYETLADLGFKYDSSLTYFRPQHIFMKVKLPEFRVQLPSALLNFPMGLQAFKAISKTSYFPVIFFHSWEAVDVRSLLKSPDLDSPTVKKYLRPDMWVNTGETFLKRLEMLIECLSGSGLRFITLRDALASPQIVARDSP